MNRAALLSRNFLLASSLLLVACSGGNYTPDEDITTYQGASQSMLEGSGPAPDEGSLNRVSLLPSVSGNIGIELEANNEISRFLISTGVDNPEFNVTRISSPDRLVLDLLGQPSKSNRTLPVTESNLVSSVRLGAHADKSRIVLDIVADPLGAATHQVETVDGKILVTLTKAAPVKAAFAPDSQSFGDADAAKVEGVLNEEEKAADETRDDHAPHGAKLESASSSSTENSDTEDRHADEDASKEEHNNLVENRAPIKEQAVVAGVEKEISPHLTSFNLERTENGGNMLIANVTSAGAYSLKRTAPSEYVLKLENTKLDEMAMQTIVSPPSSGVIRSVRPVAQGEDVLLRIFSQDNTPLVAKAKAGRIEVLAGEPGADEMMAQLNPEAEPAKDPSSTEAPKAEVKEGEKPAEGEAPPVDELSALLEESPKYTGRLISLDLQDTDIDNALRIIAEVSNLNIIASEDVTGKVTLRLIDVPWDQALDVILKTNGLDKVQEGNVIRIAPVEKLRKEREALKQAQQAEEELEPLQVRYIRISYAKASDLKALSETVITERGSIAVDERSNQLIIKDIGKGIRNVAELVAKIDLRTPQVLLETQILEATRDLLRDLGMELGFEYIQSPATGNATGNNFPNSVSIGGGLAPGSTIGSAFPAAVSAVGGSAVNLLFDSADGSRSLDARISALESEGRGRIISRPSVATINNKQAQIKSVEKFRVKTPDSGTSIVQGGAGGSTSGGGSSAFETFEVGITLDVTPQASPDYYVLLDINAKSSTLGSQTVDGIPSEIERSATSTVLVSSGQTFALGGIYKITDLDTISGVPFLKDIPVVGHMFRNLKVDNSDEELIFFITPRIVEGSFDDASMKMNG